MCGFVPKLKDIGEELRKQLLTMNKRQTRQGVSIGQDAKIEGANQTQEGQSPCGMGLWLYVYERAEYWSRIEVLGTQ